MLKTNLSVFNIYADFIKQQRLIFCACFGFFCVFLLNCTKTRPAPTAKAQNPPEISSSAVNINTAGAGELEKRLPRVGRETARKIIEHREKYGAFRRPEHLILVGGMSDKKFREIRNLVKVE